MWECLNLDLLQPVAAPCLESCPGRQASTLHPSPPFSLPRAWSLPCLPCCGGCFLGCSSCPMACRLPSGLLESYSPGCCHLSSHGLLFGSFSTLQRGALLANARSLALMGLHMCSSIGIILQEVTHPLLGRHPLGSRKLCVILLILQWSFFREPGFLPGGSLSGTLVRP